ncbi:FIST N-terminal domain-containing protein [Mesonia sp.]|uniref:FIST signal transduction protein n=1 Tax=Mesonia sp. TaxID=1960830 RepID=UPI001769D004|nr:FIST N-terminal domain-containing protein [Mesonia sp.]HIB38129.1 histidine kinase [Mesonia sp.]
MKVVQAIQKNKSWEYLQPKKELNNPLVFVFGERKLLQQNDILENIEKEFPYQHKIFGSTAGEIIKDRVLDNSITVTAIEFENSTFQIERANIKETNNDSQALGRELFRKLTKENLKHIFIISEGSFVNGSALINGIEKDNKNQVKISGGLCGDNERFEKTLVSYREEPQEGEVIILGLYGEDLEITSSSCGGWIPFGPQRIITKSKDNILYEIDDIPALDLYKKYLGDKALELPHSALFFPLNVQAQNNSQPVVRTILNIDEENKSMIFAGDLPKGSKVQLMMASVDAIVGGAGDAAIQAMQGRVKKPEIALLISCIGRKLVMAQRTEEEVEEVLQIIGCDTKTTGFYSYGEIAPFQTQENAQLHNQTMTLTLISE